MRFAPLSLAGVFLISLEPHLDERGFFARAFCEQEFTRHGLPGRFPQCNISRNGRRGTLRGMHFQRPPFAEAKVVRCIRGAIFDVVIDLRPDSPTLGKWVGATLSAENGCALFVPEGFAHGFQTLEDDTDVFYHMGREFIPGKGEGLRYNDPAFGISWPVPEALLSERDASYVDWLG